MLFFHKLLLLPLHVWGNSLWKISKCCRKTRIASFGLFSYKNRWDWAYSETQHGLLRQACCTKISCLLFRNDSQIAKPWQNHGGPDFLRQAQLQKLEAQLSDSLKMNLRHLATLNMDWQNSVVSQSPLCWWFEELKNPGGLAMTCHSFWPAADVLGLPSLRLVQRSHCSRCFLYFGGCANATPLSGGKGKKEHGATENWDCFSSKLSDLIALLTFFLQHETLAGWFVQLFVGVFLLQKLRCFQTYARMCWILQHQPTYLTQLSQYIHGNEARIETIHLPENIHVNISTNLKAEIFLDTIDALFGDVKSGRQVHLFSSLQTSMIAKEAENAGLVT